ncbi:MAG: Essential protein Yae1, N terminal [Icmadophila ericetorum]|nr:Essential protein Yae1, N terminal [Icmadophila ericetorum]
MPPYPPSSPPLNSRPHTPSTAPKNPPPHSPSNSPPDSPFYSDPEPFGEPFREPSDIPRLQSQHSTAGYRDGVSVSKSKHLQVGFDEGYSLGAVMGLRVGEMVGILEGVAGGLRGGTNTWWEEKEDIDEVKALLKMAREKLALEKVFGREFWGEDGIWRYTVVPEEKAPEGSKAQNKQEGDGGGEEKESPKGEVEEEVTFKDVVDQHPLIKSWTERIEVVARKWGLEAGRRRWTSEEWERGRIDGG